MLSPSWVLLGREKASPAVPRNVQGSMECRDDEVVSEVLCDDIDAVENVSLGTDTSSVGSDLLNGLEPRCCRRVFPHGADRRRLLRATRYMPC